jgi:hypothetical protein
MENNDKKMSNGMKMLGASLLFLAIPGSALALPWLIQKIKKNYEKKDSTNQILGI